MRVNENILLERAACGDTDAFAELYDRVAPRMLGLIVHITGSREGAEDILQNACFKAWRKARDYEPAQASPAVWMLMIARTQAIDALRRAGRYRARLEEIRAEITDESFEWNGVLDESASVWKALRELPAEQRDAVMLSFCRGLTHPEIAAALDLPLGTVKTRINLGMRKLRMSLHQFSSPEAKVVAHD